MLPNTNATLSRSHRWYTTFGLSVSAAFARPLMAVAISAPAAVKASMIILRRCIDFSIGPAGAGVGPSFAPHGGEFLAIGHQRPALLEACAVEPEHAVVRAPAERKSIFIGLVIAPDADGAEPDLGRFAVPGKLHADAAPRN